MLARHWRSAAAVVCLAVTLWAAWATAGVLGEWLTPALFLLVPALVTVALAPAWRSGAAVTGGLLAGLAGLVLASTRWPHALRPPQTDWLLPYLGLALVAWVVAFTTRVAAADTDRRRTLLMAGAGAGVALLCLAGIIAGGGPGGLRPGMGDIDVDRHDLFPLPAALQAKRVGEDCTTGTGVCTEAEEVWSATGRPPGEVAELIARHLRTKDWPMAADPRTGRLTGCLPIRGVLRWADQVCAELVPSADLQWPKDVRHREDSVLLILADHPLIAPWQEA